MEFNDLISIGDIILNDEIKIDDIELSVEKTTPPLIDLEVTPTSETQIFTHEGEYGYDTVQVNGVIGEDKEVIITENGTQTILPSEGYSNLSSVEVTTQVAQGTDFERNGTLTGDWGFMKNFNKIKLYKNNDPTDKSYTYYCRRFYGATELDFSEFRNFDINNGTNGNLSYLFSECNSLLQIDLNEIGLKDIRTDKNNKSFDLQYFANNCTHIESAKLPTIEIPTLETRPHYEDITVKYNNYFENSDYTGSGTNWIKRKSTEKCTNARGCTARRYFEQLTEGVVYYKLIPTSETTGYFEEDPNPEVVYFDEFKTDISSAQYMFNGCSRLVEVDFGENDLIMSSTTSTDYQYMFYGCSSLMKINAPNVEWHNINGAPTFMMGRGSVVPYECEIIVKNQTEKDWWNTYFPNYTNVKIKSEVVE